MIFTVVWIPKAEAMLARIWNAAKDRAAVAEAADRIDALLKRDPLTVGESRSGSLRVLYSLPLAVHYEVSEMDRLVRVLRVWRVR
jgi:plasmid stabilization system protein ParE